VAARDINGDGIDDIIVGAGPGGLPQTRIFDGFDLDVIHNVFAFGAFSGGVFVG
jgi:hypothetical protein